MLKKKKLTALVLSSFMVIGVAGTTIVSASAYSNYTPVQQVQTASQYDESEAPQPDGDQPQGEQPQGDQEDGQQPAQYAAETPNPQIDQNNHHKHHKNVASEECSAEKK